MAIHGKLDPLVHVDLTPEKRVKVTFTYGDLVEVNLRFARRPNLINVRLIKFKDYRLSVAMYIYIYISIGQFIRLIYSKRGKREGWGGDRFFSSRFEEVRSELEVKERCGSFFFYFFLYRSLESGVNMNDACRFDP